MKTFAIYGRDAEIPRTVYDENDKAGVVFDVEWKSGVGDLADAVTRDKQYEPVAVFRLNTGVGGWWLREREHKFWLVINKDSDKTIYSAEDVMNGKASEHVEQLLGV